MVLIPYLIYSVLQFVSRNIIYYSSVCENLLHVEDGEQVFHVIVSMLHHVGCFKYTRNELKPKWNRSGHDTIRFPGTRGY